MAYSIIGNPASTLKSESSLASRMEPSERKSLAVQGLARTEPLTALAREHQVSRKFLYGQIDKADQALDGAFCPSPKDDGILFRIPVTKQWLQQLALCGILHCHGSYWGVHDLVRDTCNYELSVAAIHDIVRAAVQKARGVNAQEILSGIRVGAHDEIFQGDPVLVGVDPISTYCYLLAQEPSRDATTWGVHLLELSERGLQVEYTVADAAKGLRTAQADAWPGVPCRADVFHIESEMTAMVTYLENRAYGRMATRHELDCKALQAKRKMIGADRCTSMRLHFARNQETTAIQLADDMRVLVQWMRHDVLALIGPDAQTRRELFDFIVTEIRAREHLAPEQIRLVRTALENQRDRLLAFAEDIDRQLAAVARDHQVPLKDVRQVFEMGLFAPADPVYWQRDCALWKRLGPLYPLVREAIAEVARNIVRASSMVENLNSRLRCYFFLRRSLGPEYLDLLRFFLNHRRYPRSRKDERAEKSPAEILKGVSCAALRHVKRPVRLASILW